MARRILPLLLCLLTVLPAAAAETVVMVLGDSLSAAYGIDREAGWVALLAKRLHNQGYEARVVNASISGDTSGGGLSRLPAALERHQPDVLIVELGGNDGLRGIPLQETRRNLSHIVAMAQQRGIRVLLLGVRLPPNYGAVFTERFQAMYRDLARQHDVPLVPRFLEHVATHPSLMQPDGIHPTAAAQPRLLANVWPKLKPLLQGAWHVPPMPAARRSPDPSRMP
ncbi:MAG: arylesterase [Nitrococcus sp.]|nr:arylesterase [Nitrococcus sp.]